MNKVLLGLKSGAGRVGSAIANSRTLQVIIVVSIITAVIYFKGKSDGKDALAKYDAKKLPSNGSGIPEGFDNIANQLVDDLYKSFTSWVFDPFSASSLGSYREALYTVLMSYTNDMVTAVYNKYNARYGTSRSKTLTTEIEDTYLGNNKEILIKLKSLGLL
ncbi:hypothetical protein VB776_16350 [Arcicella sp. DC2W]|uniref:Annexin n=1 Tax=Arcicella gelida TaxID=2984195 RepID=A0ABU5S7W8_9BACT|nr:hypothetical protein [Arcicella sp. DC2W]MEA5404505.1 hypothetical protein [Arcicella sp. DC2W]